MGQAVAEKMAHQNWCPEVRIAAVINGDKRAAGGMEAGPAAAVVTVNRHPERRNPFEGAYCIGAKCMHWQWMSVAGRDKKGYCGKSGRPQN